MATRANWYQNTQWSAAIEAAFEERLRRARRKTQYLRIQASTLARSNPMIALRLLERYFELADDDLENAQAHVDRATALSALGRSSEAIAAYEAALAREAAFPSLLTQAYLGLPYLVAITGDRDFYSLATRVLRNHEHRLTFPVEHFRWHAARALIAADSNQPDSARLHARKALSAAERQHSGYRFHPSFGLVGVEDESVIQRLKTILE